MKSAMIKPLLFIVLSLFTAQTWANSIGEQDAEKGIPAYVGHVNDFAGVLNDSEIQTLERQLYAFEDSTGVQFFVVIEQKLGYSAFERSLELCRAWGVGLKGKDNGLMLYLNLAERHYHTQVAEGLQGYISASRLGEVNRNLLVPALKQSQYADGISQVMNAYVQMLKGEYTGRATRKNKKDNGWSLIIALLVLLLISIGGRRGGRGGGFHRRGRYHDPVSSMLWGAALGSAFGGRSSGGFGDSGFGGWGGAGGGGGFNGGGAGGSW
jgi:uncharacterized protein